MEKIAILTDSSCDLNEEELRQKNLFLIPLKIIYKDKEFNDKIDITTEEVYANLENEIPTTSLASPDYINSVLDKIESEGYTHVIAIFISETLSGTFNAARLALEHRHNKFKYYLFNSKIIGYPLGTIVNRALHLVSEGKSFEYIIKELPSIRKATTGYYTLNTLEYLKRGGRIGKVAGTVGELLHLKPIISVNEEGAYCSVAKARGRKQSLNKLKNLIIDELDKEKSRVWILQGHAKEEAEELVKQLKYHPNLSFIEIRDIGAAMAVHAGPGMIGVAIQKDF
ncbi:DegV family protein [Clostridium tarantellae]|uniref:DegV family EDD domain-containing protein n=1 Tax=Clostridium tarantellae TaxID=39493 RepID=A0A6I1MG96_9CLOT|nr:DegV family protein [Clostridium tarantellae]MPQ42200.1 DegV family EDD domain-containing protein [Clostridium tarantellae]